jgi:hypothetical protein
MADSPLLTLPYLAASQAQKHVTHNEALSMIDGLMHLAVVSRAITVPPPSPVDGDRYLVPADATGVWATQVGRVVLRVDGQWRYFTPREGWTLWVSDEDALLTYTGSAWVAGGVPSSLQNLSMLGVNATADATNKLSVSSSAVLFNHVGTDVQMKFNKNAVADSASILFQTGFSGRAEIGTTGDDSFHFKVSNDGATFRESIVIAAQTGVATFKNTLLIDAQAADPVTPANGQVWYNSTSGKFRARQNGTTVDVIGGGGGSSWGAITGTLSAQADLQAALNAKMDDSQASVFGLSLLDDADAAAARATLGLGSAATQTSGAFALASHTHTAANVSDFSSAADARIGAASINALSDVVIAAPASGQVLKFNGTNWVNDADATGSGGGGQAALLFQDEGVALGTAGNVDTINVKGDGIAATRSGNVVTLEQKIYKRNARWVAAGSTSVTNVETGALGLTGTATAAALAVTNLYTQTLRVEYLVTTAAAAAVAGWRGQVLQWWRGNAAGLGGFRLRCRWGNASGAATATNRCFVGMTNSTSAPADVEPSSLINVVGMGWDAADTNIQIITNDGTGVATKIDLGAAFPVPLLDRTEFYEIELLAQPNATEILYRVVRGTTGVVATGVVSVDLPAANLFLAPRGWMSVGGTSSVIGVSLMFCEVGADY